MTKRDQQELKILVKEGALEALHSKEGQDAIAEALKTPKSQDAIAEAILTKTGKEAFAENFAEAFHDVVVPALEDISDDIKTLKSDVKYLKDNHEVRISRLERKTGIVV